MNALTLIATLFSMLSLSACADAHHRESRSDTDRIELLAFEGCPHTPTMRHRLREALSISQWPMPLKEIDLTSLASSDPRRRFASPTILVDGSDLFGAEPGDTTRLQCRVYPDGLPSVDDIASALRRRVD